MTWGAHKADVRVAARNSVTMRAALRASINARAIYEAYQDTYPYVTDNITQDRTRARAWAMLHVKIDNEPIAGALKKIYADGFLLGLDASAEAIGQAKTEFNKAAITKAKKKEESPDYVDWNNWKPGNRAAALLYRPTGAFEKLLNNAGITSKKIAANGFDRIGTALADSIAAGFSPARAAKVITEKIGDPARALTIAITEQNRAMSLAAMENYQNGGVEKVEWSGANPCEICAPNEGQVVPTGEAFASGDTEPPVHPNCRCAVLPVIDDEYFAEPNASGVDDIMPAEEAAPEEQAAPKELTGLDQNEYQILNAEEREKMSIYQLKNKPFMELMKTYVEENGKVGQFESRVYGALKSYKGIGYEYINEYLRTGKESKWQSLSKIKESIADISRAMKRAPGLPEPIMTYRSVNNPDLSAFLKTQSQGKIWADKGFVSTTMDQKFASDWESGVHKWLITIENPAGTKGIMLDGLRYKKAGLEAEWLLPSDTKFEVIKTDLNTQTMTVRVTP